MTSIKNLNLSPEIYTLLIDNGIKTVEGLSKYSEKELGDLKSFQKYHHLYRKDITDEIKAKMKLYSFPLDTDSPILDTEKNVRELGLSSVVIGKLRLNGVVTQGVLSTLDERDFCMMRKVGKKTLSDVKSILSTENGKIKKQTHKEMVYKGLSEEEIEYYKKQVEKVQENFKLEKQQAEELKKSEEEKRQRKSILFNEKLSDLHIPNPIFKDNRIIEDPRIVDIIFRPKESIINSLEIENALSRLKIKHLHLGMTPSDNVNLEVTELDLKRIEEFKIERHIEDLKILEKIYEIKLQNEGLKTRNLDQEKMTRILEKVLKEKEELERKNYELNAKLNMLYEKLEIPIGEDVQGQSTR